MRIKVTQQDIDAGTRRSCLGCPIALALGRMVPGVSVGQGQIIWVADGEYHERDTPSAVRRFISSFDDGYPVEPVVFDI